MLHTTKTTEKFRRGVSDAQPLLGCELQNLVLRVLLCCCSKWEFCQWSLAAHAFCVLTLSSLLNDRTGSSEKSPHTRFLGAVESRGFFFCGFCLYNQQTMGSGSCCYLCAVLDDKKGKECQGRLQVFTWANLPPWVSQQFQHNWHRKL